MPSTQSAHRPQAASQDQHELFTPDTLAMLAADDSFTDRPYQVRCVHNVVTGLRDGGRGQVRAACGTGKTRMALWSAQRLVSDGGVVVIVAPTVGLVAQTLAVWKAHGVDYTALAVCSDDTVNPDSAGRVEDIVEPVTTDPDMVDAWLRRPHDKSIRLIVGTHLSAHVIGEGLQKAVTSADLLVIDEAHRTAGRVDKHTALLHDDDVLPARRRLYMTATPRMFRRDSRTEGAVLSMDDTTVFGPSLFEYPFSRAIAEGYLDDYQVAVIGVTEAEVLSMLRGRSGEQRADPTGRRLHTAMLQAVTARAAADLGLSRIIAFCPRISAARDFAETLPDTVAALPASARPAVPLHTGWVEGSMSQRQRDQCLELLRTPPGDGWSVISNARCLSEGIDVPAVDAVLFTAPKSSTVEIVQAIGRALRYNPDGTGVSTIIVPILLHDTVDPTDPSTFDSGAFDTLWQIVRALRAHDDLFAANLDMFRATGGHSRGVMDRIRVSMPGGGGHDPAFLEHLTVKLVDVATSDWWDGYRHLAAFHDRHGHTDLTLTATVPTPDGGAFALGQWTNRARAAFHAGRLDPARIAALDKIGFVYDVHEHRWNRNYAIVAAYHAENQTLAMPFGTRRDGLDMPNWLSNQRALRRRGALSDERVERLDALGMDWDPSETVWREHLTTLRRFHARYGHINVPEDMLSDNGANLHAVLGTMRSRYRAGDLPGDRARDLDALGIEWDTSNQLAWHSVMTTLRAHHAEHGHILRIPADLCDARGVNVADWLGHRRAQRERGELTPAQIADLDALGMVWEKEFSRTAATLHDLRSFHRRHGTINDAQTIPDADPDERAYVASTVSRFRRTRYRGELSDVVVTALDELGIDWSPTPIRRRRWDAAYAALAAYHRQHGTIDVDPDDDPLPGTDIPDWLERQRAARREGRLDAERTALLDKLGMDWSDHEERLWQRAYDRAAAYHAAHGSIAFVPVTYRPDGFDLRTWVRRNLRFLQQDQLPADRRAKLLELGILDTSPPPTAPPATAPATRTRTSTAPRRPTPIRLRRLTPLQQREQDLQLLRDYHAEHGSLHVTRATPGAQAARVRAIAKRLRAARAAHRVSAEHVAVLDALGFVWDPGTGDWAAGLAAATLHHATTGHLDPSGTYRDPVSGLYLAQWLSRRRAERAAGELPADRVAALDALGMCWDPRQRQWQRGLDTATAYHAEHGNLDCDDDHIVAHPDGTQVNLRAFLDRQRKHHARHRLAPDRVAALDALGIDWHDTPERDTRWHDALAALAAFHARHRHIRVSRSTPATDRHGKRIDLVDYLSEQRTARRNKQLPADRVAALDALGMDWTPSDTAWNTQLAALRAHHAAHGDLDVPRGRLIDGVDLGDLLDRLRVRHRAGRLSADRVAALDALGIVWEPAAEAWNEMLRFVRDHHATHGNLTIHHNVRGPRGTNASDWLQRQRHRHATGEMTPAQFAALDALGMVWEKGALDEQRWQSTYRLAEKFRAENGHLRVPTGRADPKSDTARLYVWLVNQRSYYHAGELAEHRINALERLDIEWTPLPAKERSWRDHLARIADIQRRHGHLDFTKLTTGPDAELTDEDARKLAKWLGGQRALHAKGALSGDRVARARAAGIDLRQADQIAWAAALDRIDTYRRDIGDPDRMPGGYRTPDGFHLYHWRIRAQRLAEDGKLTSAQRHDLTSRGITPHTSRTRAR